jgi:hypothetical protein
MARNAKSDVDFSDMSEADRVRLVAQTALIAQESGGVEVFNGTFKGVQGVMIWIAGYAIEDGEMNAVEAS